MASLSQVWSTCEQYTQALRLGASAFHPLSVGSVVEVVGLGLGEAPGVSLAAESIASVTVASSQEAFPNHNRHGETGPSEWQA